MENQRVHDTEKDLDDGRPWLTMSNTRQNIAKIVWMLQMTAIIP